MDLLRDLMNVKKPLQRIQIPTGQVDGHMLYDSDSDHDSDEMFRAESVEPSINYAAEYQRREEQLYTESLQESDNIEANGMDTVDQISCAGRSDLLSLAETDLLDVYGKYNFDKHRQTSLPIDEHHDQILRLINTNQVVIIQGPTGCGKTTQVPQFILEDHKINDQSCKIIVTQPRRIAAISVAKRVCEERGWTLGGICGYQVGLDNTTSSDTLLSYVTTGVLLKKLIKAKTLNEYTHIIVDEVHERNQDMDFLLFIIRRFLNTHSKNTKIVLMSATFNTEEFANYFKNFHDAQFIPAPVIFVDKACRFSTQVFYADQLTLLGQVPTYHLSEPKIEPFVYTTFAFLIRAFDKLDTFDSVTQTTQIGNVLVFLPGILEIEEAHEQLTLKLQRDAAEGKNKVDWQILPLHSSITIEEQRKVFVTPPKGVRKIILSTNIAESSITVSDITFVIDFCLTKTMVMDCDTQYQSLQLQWASHINCTQRAGRVGRVSDGRIYRLVREEFYVSMPKSVMPEILRAPLNQVVLNSKLLELNEPPKAILALTMNPPNLSNIENSVLYLKEIGALTMACNGQKMVSDGDITFMGRVMAELPLDVHLSKFILLGHIFSCLEDAVIMATGCSLNVFKSPFKERLKAYTNRLQWADGSASDLVAYLHLYNVWQRKRRTNSNAKVEKDWCEKNFVSLRSLHEWYILVKEIKARLDKMGIRQGEGSENVSLSQSEVPMFVKVVMCGAFYPNYFKRSSDGGQIDEREAVKTLGGRDPSYTVHFTGFDYHQPGPLYAKSIKKILKECATDMHISFDNSSKVYVQFLSSHQLDTVTVDGQQFVTRMPGKIRTEVYRAVRHRQLKLANRIDIMNTDQAWSMVKSMGIDEACCVAAHPSVVERPSTSWEDGAVTPHPQVIPSLDLQYLILGISHRIDAGHFWAHNCTGHTAMLLTMIGKMLNNETTSLTPVNPEIVIVDKLYASKFHEDSLVYRCKVLSLNPFGQKQMTFAQILYIDYGNTEFVKVSDLFILPDLAIMTSPPQAIECFLSEVQPSVVLNPRALWSEEAIKKFDLYTHDKQVYGKIYSVVNGIVHLELYRYETPVRGQCKFQDSLNAWMIRQGYAQHAEESFLSKENNIKRTQVADNPEQLSALLKEEEDSQAKATLNVDLPIGDCTSVVHLKGPYSPLEMQIFSVVASGANKKAVIEGNSVNTVLLDTDPQDPHERLIVAGHIGQNPSGTALSLRHTTLMPNIHGFPMIMSLLFCPIMEPKPTPDGTRIGAILCGLGRYDNSHQSIFGAHDVSLTLDTELTEDDINQINELRYWMNVAVDCMDFVSNGIPSTTSVSECQREIKLRLIKLLRTKRKSVDRAYVKYANVWGKSLYDGVALFPGAASRVIHTVIWPLHWSIKLNTDATTEDVIAMSKHIDELKEIVLNMKTPNSNEIVCKLCNQLYLSALEMRVHMSSRVHIEAERNFTEKCKNLHISA